MFVPRPWGARGPEPPGTGREGRLCSGRVQGMRGWEGDASREGQASPGMTGGKEPVSHPGVTHGARGSPSPLMCCQGQVPTAPVAVSVLRPDPEGEPDGCCGTCVAGAMERSLRPAPAPAPPALCAPGSRQGLQPHALCSGEQKAGTHHSPDKEVPSGMGSTLLPAEDPAPSPRVGLVPGGDSLALGSPPWCQQVGFPPPPHSTGVSGCEGARRAAGPGVPWGGCCACPGP